MKTTFYYKYEFKINFISMQHFDLKELTKTSREIQIGCSNHYFATITRQILDIFEEIEALKKRDCQSQYGSGSRTY